MPESGASAARRPAVSVIVPVYNAERFLEQCLDSVLAQSFDDYEVICVNDGSTDSSPSVLEEYAASDGRFKVVSQPNGGLSAARNTGIEHAAGDYIAFLDSDDWLEPRMLELTVAAGKSTDAEVVVFDYWIYDNESCNLSTYRDQALYSSLHGSVFSLETCPEMARFIGVWDRLFKRDFIERYKFRFADGMIYEDVPFCVDTLLKAKRMTMVADHLYYYRRNVHGSITNAEMKSVKHKEAFLAVQSYAASRYQEEKVSREVWKNYAWYFMEYAEMHLRQIRSMPFSEAFYNCLAEIACAGRGQSGPRPDLTTFGQRSFNPERAVFQRLLATGSPMGEYAYLKVVNVSRRIGRGIRYRLSRAGKR